MILPKKHLSPDRSLLYLGAELIELLRRPKTVSSLWNDFTRRRAVNNELSTVTYDWFILALDFLNAVGAIEMSDRFLRRRVG